MTQRDVYEVGQRVCRPFDVFNASPLRYGVVTERYSSSARVGGVSWFDHELYAVKWDDTGREERGYFRHGLQPVVDVGLLVNR